MTSRWPRTRRATPSTAMPPPASSTSGGSLCASKRRRRRCPKATMPSTLEVESRLDNLPLARVVQNANVIDGYPPLEAALQQEQDESARDIGLKVRPHD